MSDEVAPAPAAPPRRPARWYFDLISPFAYLQLQALSAFEDRLAIEPAPLLFAGLLQHHGQLGPAEIPGKRRHTYRYTHWLARREGIAFRAPPRHPFNPLPALRLLAALDGALPAVRAAFDVVWGEGQDLASADGWAALCARLGVTVAEAEARIADPAAKARVTGNGAEAIALGVYGVPTLVVDGELFWGYEAIPMLRDFLDDPALFATEDMQRLEAITPAVERRR